MKDSGGFIKEVNEALEQVGDAWEATLDIILKRPLSLHEISESYSKKTDDFILEVEKFENVNFVAGKFFIRYASKGCTTNADLYFQNPRNEAWIKKELKGFVPIENVENESGKKIAAEKVVEYDISHPGV